MSGLSLFPYESEQFDRALQDAPATCGVLALFGALGNKPYLAKTTNLKRRVHRLLGSAGLRERIGRIAWRETGSDFESNLILYDGYSYFFDAEEARKRLKLRAPYFVCFAAENRFPRLYVSNKLTKRSLTNTFGPFASRTAAERYIDRVNDLFHLRRCPEELEPSTEHLGCVYGEMKKCSAPCQLRISESSYAQDAEQVRQFLLTKGQSLLTTIAAARDRASEAMEFEEAAAAHTRFQAAKEVAQGMGELVRSVDMLCALLLLPAAGQESAVEVWLLHRGYLLGPAHLSTIGVRVINEQAHVGTSLFAQPLMLQPVPEEGPQKAESAEDRLVAVIHHLQEQDLPAAAVAADHLALLKRWYYRPEAKRVGAICFQEEGTWPVRKIVRTAAKLTLKMDPVPDAAAKD